MYIVMLLRLKITIVSFPGSHEDPGNEIATLYIMFFLKQKIHFVWFQLLFPSSNTLKGLILDRLFMILDNLFMMRDFKGSDVIL